MSMITIDFDYSCTALTALRDCCLRPVRAEAPFVWIGFVIEMPLVVWAYGDSLTGTAARLS